MKRAPRADGRGSPWVDGHVAAYDREVAALMRVPAHTAGVYQFVASLYRAASIAQAGGKSTCVVWWETGRACARQYWEIAEGWHALRSDAAGEYQAGTQRLQFWLEWDRGTMQRCDLAAKFTSYAHYVRTREWRSDGNTSVPHLLIVTSDVGQETQLLAALAIALAGGRCTLAVRVSLRDQLTAYGALSDIWRPWQRSSDSGHRLGQPCRALS